MTKSNSPESHPHQSSSDRADPEAGSTPAGVVRDIEELSEMEGGTTDPDMVQLPDVDLS